MKAISLAILVAIVVGCSKPAPPTFTLPWGPYPKYDGQSRQAVEAAMGLPSFEDSFTIDQVGDEMRMPLRNTYPWTNPANLKVLIVELWWDDGDHWITLWFHKVNGTWEVFESLRWHKDVRF